jgi:N-ethylmaleimide reductase
VQRIRTGAPLAEALQEYWYGGDETGYSDWLAVQRQAA